MIIFFWCFLMPFSTFWTVLGTMKFFDVMTHSASCVSTQTQIWRMIFWLMINYAWFSIYLFYFFIACTIEYTSRSAETNMRLIETPESLSRWGHLLPVSLTSETFVTSDLWKGQKGMKPCEIEALPD